METSLHKKFGELLEEMRQSPDICEHRTNRISDRKKIDLDLDQFEVPPEDLQEFCKERKWNPIPTKRRFLSEQKYFLPNQNIGVVLDCVSRWEGMAITSESQRFLNSKDIFYHPTHYHEFFELTYLYSGTCYRYMAGNEYRMKAGQFWIYNSQIKHGMCIVGRDTNLINILIRKTTFEQTVVPMLKENKMFLDFFLESIYNFKEGPSCLQFEVPQESSGQYCLYKLTQEFVKDDMYSQQIMLFSLCSLLMELSRQYAQVVDQQPEKISRELTIEQVISYLNDNYAAATLKSTATFFNYSSEYISRLISRKTGKSFSEWRLEIQMQHASELLSKSHLPIDLISQQIGYSERRAFDYAFKKYFQVTPAQYRKEFFS